VSRGQFDALCRNEINQRVGLMPIRQHFSHRPQHLFVSGGSADTQHFGVSGADGFSVFAPTHAARDQHPAVFADRFTNRLEALFFGGIDETAGIDDDHTRVVIVRSDFVAFYSELGQDPFGVDQGFGTPQ
jgi:hypothetical protein